MFFRQKKSGNRVYLQIVENRWEDGRSKQRVIATLGRLDQLQQTAQLEGLLRSGAKFCESVLLLAAHERGETTTVRTRSIGPAMIFERLWKETGCQVVIRRLLDERKFEFAVERAIFLTVLQRLFTSGSDRAAEKWKKTQQIEGMDRLELHHLYRAMAWLGESLPEDRQAGATPFSPRCTKDLVEEGLFAHRRDLFSELDLVFYDTTSIYFEGEGGDTLGQHGHSKDHRPDLKQMVVAAVLDGEGRPLCCELWPGNTTDVTTLIPIVNRLQSRFGIRRICIVADRGMISKKTLEELESPERRWQYILGARMRSQKEVRQEVLARGGRFREVHSPRIKRKDPSPLKVKEVLVEGRRYVVCLNEEEARKDAHDRQAIVASLREQLQRGDKSLVGNRGYVALKYKQLWMVEHVFRSAKSLLETRPIWHKCDETIRGHVFCSFLALVLRKELDDRLAEQGHKLEWEDVIRDLVNLQTTQVEQDGKRFLLRSESQGTCGKVFAAVGVALPPTVQQIEAS